MRSTGSPTAVRSSVRSARRRLPAGARRPAAGYITKRTAQGWLDEVLAEARRGSLPGMVRTGATFADAAAEWLSWCEHERDCKPSTLADYRTTARTLNRDLGDLRIEDVTSRTIEEWLTARPGTNTTKLKYLVILHGIFRRAMRVWGLPRNPTDDIDRPRVRISDDIDAFSPRGGPRARPRRGHAARRDALPHRRLHRPAAG